MLKKTKIAAATTMALLGAVAQNASAVTIDESGDNAQILIYPYYNVNNGFQTAFNIRNTKDEYKVLKVRYRESGISNDVLDFNVYMSPFDHFSMTVTQAENGDAVMSTTDTTCTFPAIPEGGVPFVHSVYDATEQEDTREGYLEVIEMGILPDGDVSGDGDNDLWAAIKHVDGVPGDCGLIGTAWSNGYFSQGGASDGQGGFYASQTPLNIDGPTGGIQGYSILIDVPRGAAFVADPAAIRNYSTLPQHYRSDDQFFYLLPSLASGSDLTSVVMNDDGTASITNTWTEVSADWGLSDPGVAPNISVASGVNPFPIADVLAATGLHNDYFINPDFDGATDWVVTMPMRKHGIFNGYRFDGLPATDTHPVNLFGALAGSVDVTFRSTFYDREEGIPDNPDAGFSPAVQGVARALPREVNILTFENSDNPTNDVLGSDTESSFTLTLENGFVQGWGQLTFDPALYNFALNYNGNGWVTAPTAPTGVPMIGFAAIRGNLADGSSINLGETVPHVFNRNR